jgi:hypothetical protein
VCICRLDGDPFRATGCRAGAAVPPWANPAGRGDSSEGAGTSRDDGLCRSALARSTASSARHSDDNGVLPAVFPVNPDRRCSSIDGNNAGAVGPQLVRAGDGRGRIREHKTRNRDANPKQEPETGTQLGTRNEEGCIRRAEARHRLPPGRCRPAGYKPVDRDRGEPCGSPLSRSTGTQLETRNRKQVLPLRASVGSTEATWVHPTSASSDRRAQRGSRFVGKS